MREQIASLDLEGSVRLTGEALKQERIPEFMADADVFCLPCVWARDDDVDGLPQLLMEAMACGLAAVSTRLVGIPDLVIDRKTGLLAEPGDVEGLAAALAELAGDPGLVRRLAIAGRQQVLDSFDLDRCLEPLFAIHRGRSNEARAEPPAAALVASGGEPR